MATLVELERALVNADKAGDSDAARKLAAVITKARQDSSLRIPGAGVPGTTAQAPEPTLGEQLIGAGEAALSTITGATTGAVGMLLGGANQMGQDIARYATGQPLDPTTVGEAAMNAARGLTYEPRTQSGREQTQAVGEVMQNLIPIAPLAGTLPAAAGAARAAIPVAADITRAAVPPVVQAVRSAATTIPRRALAAITSEQPAPKPTQGTLGSAGAAATDIAAQRVATAESLGLTGEAGLTRGMATRDPAQLKFEVESSKLPEGQRLRENRVSINDVLLRNFDSAVDQIGAEAPTLRAVGQAVDTALVNQWKADKAAVRQAYQTAKNSKEATALVDQTLPVAIGEGEMAISGTPISFINDQPAGLPSTAVADAARQYAVKLGVADLVDGELVPRPATIRQMEDWRKAIGQATGYEPADIRASTILKGLIDAQTEPIAGPLYRQARKERARLAQNYEDRAVISKLLNNKRGTTDRTVALEDVFDHSIIKGSLDDVRNVQRVLLRSGEEGRQAWKELQGATIQWLKNESGLDAFGVQKGVTKDASNNAVLNPAGLNKAIRTLDHDEKLQRIFGKQGAQRLRDINDIAQVAKTVPPEAGVNSSNTAATLLTAFADLGVSAASGIPAPLATVTRLAAKQIKDRKLQRRIDEALRGLETRNPKGTP